MTSTFTVPYSSSDATLATESARAKGYLAFPAVLSLTPDQRLNYALRQDLEQAETIARERRTFEDEAERRAKQERDEQDRAWEERQRVDAERRHQREEREREQALIGEMSWVRSGGVLRDADGRRDLKRTEEIRKLVQEEDAQRLSLERWDAYETAWTALLSSQSAVTFSSLPWPLITPATSTADLHGSAISEFLFDSLRVRGNKTTKKERIRSSLLRWHPDKLGSVLSRVTEEDVDAVKSGIDAVVMALMDLQETEKSERV